MKIKSLASQPSEGNPIDEELRKKIKSVLNYFIERCSSTFFKSRNLWNIIELFGEPRY